MLRIRSVLVGIVLWSAGTWAAAILANDPYHQRQDVDAGGRIENIKGGKRFFVNERSDTVPGRAELRGLSSTTEVAAGGRFRLISGGRWVSVLQILNVVAAGETGGAAKPVSQLGIRLSPGSADRYQFFIVQGAHRCINVPDFTIGTYHKISVSARAGGDPEYKIDGFSCVHENMHGYKAGRMLEGRRLSDGHYFYAKLGAYQTWSNQSHQGGNSAVEWTDIHI